VKVRQMMTLVIFEIHPDDNSIKRRNNRHVCYLSKTCCNTASRFSSSSIDP